MAFDWDNLFKYDTGFNPTYTQEQSNPQIGRDRFAELTMPEYDMNPMRRYTSYLGQEPTRDQYKPNFWQNLLFGLSGGVEAMSSGNLARGIQLTDALRDRPYEDAYKAWNTRGNKLKADVELANVDYRNKASAYDKAQQRANQERTIADAEKRTQLQKERLDFDLKKFENSGWEVKPSGNGKYVATRINPITGQAETQDTGVSTNELTPQDRIKMFTTEEEGRNRRAAESNATSRYGTDMQRESARERNATDLYSIETRKYEGQKARELQREVAQMPSRSNIKGNVTPPTPVDMRTAQGLVTKGYPEFNKPELISMQGNTIMGRGLETSNPNEWKRIMRQIASETGQSPEEIIRRWEEFKGRASAFAPKVRK